jgi:hypothetical protein
MRTTIFALCFLSATGAAYGQSASVLANNPQPLQMAGHVEHASQHALAQETSLIGGSSYSYAKGEVPLAELASPMYHTPLGDLARAAKKEHASDPKAAKVFEN